MIEWGEWFYYDETSPSCLRWAVSRFTGKKYTRQLVSPGDVAGTANSDGYFRVMASGNNVLVHRAIWELHNGPIPSGLFIDHIDRVPGNNKLSNLRLVSNTVNVRNAKLSSNNTTGVTGVVRRTRQRGGARPEEHWEASWRDLSGKAHGRAFSVRKHGEKAFELACKARAEAIKQLNAQRGRLHLCAWNLEKEPQNANGAS